MSPAASAMIDGLAPAAPVQNVAYHLDIGRQRLYQSSCRMHHGSAALQCAKVKPWKPVKFSC